MGWNGSGGARSPQKPKVTVSKPSPVRGIVAGLVVVALAAAAYFLLFSGDKAKKPVREDAKKSLIKEVAHAVAPKAVTNAAPVKKELTKDEKRLKEIAEIKARYAGKEMPKGVSTRLYYLERPPTTHLGATAPTDFFRHPSERIIAGTVLVEPGTAFLDPPTYGESFDQDFINAMLDKIEINDDDTEYVRNLKVQMTEAKKDIARICKEEGRKPSEIVNEYTKTLVDLGRYNEMLQRELAEIRSNPDLSDDDIRDAFKAANIMLEKKGLQPIAVPTLTRRAFQIRKMKEAAARKAAQQQEGE